LTTDESDDCGQHREKMVRREWRAGNLRWSDDDDDGGDDGDADGPAKMLMIALCCRNWFRFHARRRYGNFVRSLERTTWRVEDTLACSNALHRHLIQMLERKALKHSASVSFGCLLSKSFPTFISLEI